MTLADSDFPTFIDDLALVQVAIKLAVSGAEPIPPVTVSLKRTVSGTSLSGTAVTDAAGLASTRRGASEWRSMLGIPPAGEWEVSLTDGVGDLISAGKLTDVLLVIGWQGFAPAWPS